MRKNLACRLHTTSTYTATSVIDFIWTVFKTKHVGLYHVIRQDSEVAPSLTLLSSFGLLKAKQIFQCFVILYISNTNDTSLGKTPLTSNIVDVKLPTTDGGRSPTLKLAIDQPGPKPDEMKPKTKDVSLQSKEPGSSKGITRKANWNEKKSCV